MTQKTHTVAGGGVPEDADGVEAARTAVLAEHAALAGLDRWTPPFLAQVDAVVAATGRLVEQVDRRQAGAAAAAAAVRASHRVRTVRTIQIACAVAAVALLTVAAVVGAGWRTRWWLPLLVLGIAGLLLVGLVADEPRGRTIPAYRYLTAGTAAASALFLILVVAGASGWLLFPTLGCAVAALWLARAGAVGPG